MAATKKAVPHSSAVTLIGDLVEPAQVITPGVTEWPKVGCRVRVAHNPDQATVFVVVSIGPVAEAMMRMKVGRTVKVIGQLKAATGVVEVFATEFTRAAADQGRAGYRAMFNPFELGLGLGPPPPPEKSDEDDED